MSRLVRMIPIVFLLAVLTAGTVQAAEMIGYPDAAGAAENNIRVSLVLVDTLAGQTVDDPATEYKMEYYSPRQLGDFFFNHQDGVNKYLQEASYGQIGLSGSVAGWFQAGPADLDADRLIKNYHQYLRLAENTINLASYDVLYLVALVKGRGAQIGWKSGQQRLKTSRGVIDGLGIVFMVNSPVYDQVNDTYSQSLILPSTSWAHELLHSLGINGHANSLDCGNLIICPDRPKSIKAYGNPFSLMGSSGFSTHPDVMMKMHLGWLDKEQVLKVKTSGDYTIYPLETDDGRVKGLRIPLKKPYRLTDGGLTFSHLFVEYRTDKGFDRYLARLDGGHILKRYKPEGAVDRNGVLVYLDYDQPDTQSTLLLDMNPATSFNPKRGIKWPGNPGKFADAFLPVGQTYTDPKNGIDLTPIELTDDGGIKIQVSLDAR